MSRSTPEGHEPPHEPTNGRKPIRPNPPRWQPNPDPDSIVVPGLDTSAPVNDQIDYIEQLITVKLQNVDENMAKIHHLLTSKMLPDLKKYAVGTEPVREAAKFWVNFFEKAARVRLPIYDDFSSLRGDENPSPSQAQQPDAEPMEAEAEADSHSEPQIDTTAQLQSFDPDQTPSENSFMPSQGVVSSTPATFSRHRTQGSQESFSSQASDEAPWTASLESPLRRLDREIKSLSADDTAPHVSSYKVAPTSFGHFLPDPPNQANQSKMDKGKSREIPEPLLQKTLRGNLLPKNETIGSNARGTIVSPLKLRRKPATPKASNPFLPPDTRPEAWNGLVDLKNTPLATPKRAIYASSSSLRPAGPQTPPNDDSDDDEDLYPPGMSPLTTIVLPPPTRPSGYVPRLAKSPKKAAAQRIGRDLISDAEKKAGRGTGTESSASTLPTPPSLLQYTREGYEVRTGGGTDVSSSGGVDTSLESLMKRVGLNTQNYVPGPGPPPEVLPAAPEAASFHVPVAEEPRMQTPEQVPYDFRHIRDDGPVTPGQYRDDDFDDSMDSFELDAEEANNTGNPSAAFLLASRQRGLRDLEDSFGSSEDSLDFEDADGPVHPFARPFRESEGDGFDDDSFDDDMYDDGMGPTETVFGGQQAQRYGGDERLQMMGQELLEDTIGIGTQMAHAGRVEETPIRWSGGR